jgi:hypothetical protein
VTVAVPEFVTVMGVIGPQVRLAGTVSVSDTVPVNPFTAAIVMVEFADVPDGIAAGEVAVIVKSVMMKVAFAL